MTYYQESEWREDSYGLVRERFVVSNTIEGLYLPNTEATRANIFDTSDVSKKSANGVGGAITTEINVTINEALLKTEDELSAFNFVKEARTIINTRWAAFFVNPDETPLSSQAMFVGLIQTEMESTDTDWPERNQFSPTAGAVAEWRFKAKPFSASTIESVACKDLIYGNEAEQIPGITSAWEATNVVDRQGYFHWADENRDVVVESLVNLNSLIDILLQNLTAALAAKGFGTINFNVIGCELDPTFYPARWNRWVVQTKDGKWHNGRYVGKDDPTFPHRGINTGDYFEIYPEDGVRLKIGKPSEVTEANTVWWSYRNVKQLDNEPNPSSAKGYRIDNAKNMLEFLTNVAKFLGIYLKIYFVSATQINIEFVSRKGFKREKIYPRTATKFSTKMSSAAEIDPENKVKGDAWYLSAEGSDIYWGKKDRYTSSWNWYEGTKLKTRSNSEGSALYFTVSPTVKTMTDENAINDCWDDGFDYGNGTIPHNHVFSDAGVKKTYEQHSAHGLHTAIYLKVPKNANHPSSDLEADTYWTPAAMLAVDIKNKKSGAYETKQFYTMKDYLDSLQMRDKEYIYLESDADLPFFCSFAEDSLGTSPTWQRLDVGAVIEKDGVEYIVKEAQWRLKDKNISIKLDATEKYDFDLPSSHNSEHPGFVTPPITQATETWPITVNAIPKCSAIAFDDDGKVRFALPNELYYDRAFVIALRDADAGERIPYANDGVIATPPDWTDLLPGKPIYLNMPEATPPYSTNLSQTPVPTSNSSRNLFVQIGVATDARHFKLTQDSIRRIYPSEAL